MASSIRARGGGVHKPFLGATVIGDGVGDGAVFVRVRPRQLEGTVTLLIWA